jgi:hypothetical protein
VLLIPHERPREELASLILADLHRAGLSIDLGTGWEPYDAVVTGSTLIVGEIVTSSHPVGYVQLRIRPRLRRIAMLVWTIAVLAAALAGPAPAGVAAMAAGMEAARGLWRVRRGVRRVIQRAGA